MSWKKGLVIAGLALGAAGLAFAAAEGHDREHGGEHMRHVKFMRGASVEHAAMQNIMAELLSAKTGKTIAEIQKQFEDGHPHEALEDLGLSEEDGRALHQQAREKLIAKAQAAGLITATQAEKIRAAKHQRFERRGGRPPNPPSLPSPPDIDE